MIAAASIADFASIILLTLFFSREATGTGTKLLLLAGFVVAALVAVAGLAGLERWRAPVGHAGAPAGHDRPGARARRLPAARRRSSRWRSSSGSR